MHLDRARAAGHWLVWLALSFLVGVLAPGCDDSSPSGPDGGESFTFTGSLAADATARHAFRFQDSAIARITLVALSQTAPPPPDPDTRILSIGLSIARQADAACPTGANQQQLTFAVGDSVLIQLADRGYCLNVSDNGFIPDGGAFSYRATVAAEE